MLKSILNFKLSLENLYSVIIGLLPILSIYKDPFDIAEIGTILLLFFVPILLFRGFGNKKLLKRGYVFLYVFLIDTGASVLLWGKYGMADQYNVALLTFVIMAICLVFHLFYGIGDLFKLNVAIKTIQIMSLLNALLIMAQYAAHYLFHTYINVINSGLLVDVAQQYQRYLLTGVSNSIFRPAGFFLEPSHFSLYAIIAITTLLITNKNEKGRLVKSAIIGLGLALSTSGIGIFFALVIWVFSLFTKREKELSVATKVLGGSASLLIVVILLFQFGFFQSAVDRVFTGNLETSALYSRIYNMLFFFQSSTSIQFIGNGFMTFPESYFSYTNGAVKLLYGQGYLGALILILFLYERYRYSNQTGKVLLFCLLGMFVFAEMYSTIYLCFYLMIICSLTKSETPNALPRTAMALR